MKAYEKATALRAEYIGYYSGFGGIEVKTIDYGLEDYCIFVAGAWTGNRSVHRCKIHYETNRPYFIYNGCRIHFDEILRKGA